MNFSKWNDSINSTADAQKRFQKALSADLSPISINVNEQSGVFKGSGKNPYIVTLDNCTCGDFHRRQLPCKHIYRLAMELNIISASFETGINKNSLNQQLFSLPVETQEIFYNMCYETAYHKQIAFIFSRYNYDCLQQLIVNGFCVEALNNYQNVLLSVPVANFKNVYEALPDSKPKLNSQKKTYISYFSNNENSKELQDAIIVLEMKAQTIKNARTILSRFRSKFEKITSQIDCDEESLCFIDSTEYIMKFDNEVL